MFDPQVPSWTTVFCSILILSTNGQNVSNKHALNLALRNH